MLLPDRTRWVAVALALLAAPLHAHGEPATADSTAAIAPAFAAPESTLGHGLVRADRLQHVSLAMAIGVGVGLAARSREAGSGVALSLALAKELIDPRFDRGDLAASAIGAALAWVIVSSLTR